MNSLDQKEAAKFYVAAANLSVEIKRKRVTNSVLRECWMLGENTARALPCFANNLATLRNLKTGWPANWHNADGSRSLSHLSAHIEGVMREVRETIEGVTA